MEQQQGCGLLAAIPLVAAALAPLIVVVPRNPSGCRRTEIDRSSKDDCQTTMGLATAALFVILSLSLWFIGQPMAIGTALAWRPLTWILAQWPITVPRRRHSSTPNKETRDSSDHHPACILKFEWVQGGPLGRGCRKGLEVLCACILWIGCRGSLPESVSATLDLPRAIQPFLLASGTEILLLAFLCITLTASVNIVLSTWMQYSQPKNNHPGLNSMLQATIGRDLHWTEHIRLVALAVANAACEELTSRGFWRSEFEITACLSLHRSNILQALVFGAWHFHGIPSGWLGVALAAVYGWIMGALADYFADTVGPGLWVPILVHSMTDYYIFACLARKQNLNATP